MPISSGEPILRSDSSVATLLRCSRSQFRHTFAACCQNPQGAPMINTGREQLFTHLALVGHYCALISRATRGKE
jgi:hypothetical protein